MENKEPKRTRPEIHDCNMCKYCQESNQTNQNVCTACHFMFFEKLYRNFSSSNKEVDEIIKNPLYDHKYDGKLKYYEWIPWEGLLNINEIARGGFGIIYKATLIDGLIDPWSIKHHGSMKYERKRVGWEVAIKIMPTNSSELFKELNIQRAMFINNNYKDLYYISPIWGITQNAETLEYGIVMEFARYGDMRKYLSTNFHSTSWKHKLKMAYFIAEGLSQIHSSGMVHRDLHPGNILNYNYGNKARIGDLGLCQPVNNETTTIDIITKKDVNEKNIYGVIPYIPPEVLRGKKFTEAGDIYSFAMLLWELATGKPPFHDIPHDHILIMDILNGQRPKITSPLIPPSYAKLIEKCWDVNPLNRPTAKEVYKKLNELGFLNSEFLESEKYVKEMLKNDSITNHSTTTKRKIHPGAVFTSRVLTAQIVDFSNELVYLPEDDSL
ncbi:hypothetical protein G9A89_009124 [Geosiphon pyriformis]|nr:hypothetical protein G9A89_009124 [Geosiphon pyriformis]